MTPLIPELQLRYELWGQHEALYAQWRIAKEESEPPFIIENVRHEFDPNWRENMMSIQSAHDLNHWVWKATAVAFVLAGATGGGLF